MRAGIGVDAHRFAPGRPLMLGCVAVEHDLGLAGHSDADVLAHAVADALLGAAGLGDVGEMFPSADERWRDAAGAGLLGAVADRLRESGWRIVNVDAVVVAEAPRLAPYRDAMRAGIAGALGVDAAVVGVKATSTDGLGFAGRGEGIAATAVALLDRH